MSADAEDSHEEDELYEMLFPERKDAEHETVNVAQVQVCFLTFKFAGVGTHSHCGVFVQSLQSQLDAKTHECKALAEQVADLEAQVRARRNH